MKSEEVFEKLNETKILSVQDNDRIHTWIRGGWSVYDNPLTEYDKNYLSRLENTLGVKTVFVRSSEVIEEVSQVDPEKAEQIADMWIREAKEITHVTKKDVIRSAELYLAYKQIMKKYNVDAITMGSWAFVPDGKLKAMPPLAEMELAKELIPVCCESDIDSLITLIIGAYISGKPGFMGDHVSNWEELRKEDAIKPLPDNYQAIGHCYGPVNPHGDDRIPYVIRDHAYYELGWLGWEETQAPRGEYRKNDRIKVNKQFQEENITLIGIRTEWSADETVTIAKFETYNKKVQISTGKTFDPHPYFPDFDNTKCRTKMAIETDESFDYKLGGHLVAFHGDLKEELERFANLAGYEIISCTSNNHWSHAFPGNIYGVR